MSWLTNIFRRSTALVPERKDSAAGPLVYMQTLGRPAWTPRDYASLAKESYMQNAIAYRCVRMIAEASASVPFLLYEGEDELEEHPLMELLKKPNPFESGEQLWDGFYSFMKIAGNTYLEAVLLDGQVRELYVLRADRMKVQLGPRGYPSGYEYTVGQQKLLYAVPDPGKQLPIMHLKEFHPLDDWYGMSPVEAGAFAVDVHNAAGGFNKALLDNQARPSGALVYAPTQENADPSLTDKQFQRLKEEIEEKYSGRENAGKPMILDGGLDWKEMSVNPKDMEFIEGKREAAREIALSFGVPPQLLGIPGDNTYSNYQEANRAFYRQTVLPLVSRTCQALSNFFAPTYGETLRVWYDEDAIPALSEEREKVWERVIKADFLTTNEKREATGYEPYEPKDDTPPGDLIMVQSSQVPLTELSLEPGGAEENADEQAPDEEGSDVQPAAGKVGKPDRGKRPSSARSADKGDGGR